MSMSRVSSFEDFRVLALRQTTTMKDAAVIVVEEEPRLAEEIRFHFEAGGHRVTLSHSMAEGLRACRSEPASALVIDCPWTEEDGLAALKTLRREGNSAPIVMIGAFRSADQRIHVLNAGADDCLVSPFDVRELYARLEALWRRIHEANPARLRTGELEMCLVERKVRCMGRSVELLPQEFKLLEYFMRRPGQVVTRAMLLADIWTSKMGVRTNVVDVQIGNLRRKLDPSAERRFIINVRGAGFKLNPNG